MDTTSALPLQLQHPIKCMLGKLKAEFGADLVCVSLYGHTTQGLYQEGVTEVNLLIVLRQLGRAQLRGLAPIIQEARRSVALEPLAFSVEDLRRSTDVFPLRLLEAQRSHITLCGEDILSPVFISSEHVRLSCEREVKTTVLRLRQLYLLRAGLRPAWLEALVDAIRPFMRLLSFCLELSGRKVPDQPGQLMEMAEREIGVNRTVLARVLALREGTERPEPRELEELYESFLEDAISLGNFVDRLSRA